MELVSFAFFIGLLLILALRIRSWAKGRGHPLGPPDVPIVSVLLHIARQQNPYRALHDLSTIYGPVMRIKLGEIDTVVVSSAEAVEEIMKTHDAAFASRSITRSQHTIFYGGNELLFSPYGKQWKQMRQICTMELFSEKRVRSFRTIRETEISYLIRRLAALSGSEVDLSRMMFESSNNVISRAVIGGASDDKKKFLSALKSVTEFLGGLNIPDFFPSVPFLGHITGYQKKLQECHKTLDLIAETIIHEHKNKMSEAFLKDESQNMKEENIVDVLLRIQHEDNLRFPLSNDNIKALIIDLLLAGSETTSFTLEWAMAELIQNPNILKKAQNEIREVIGRGNQAEQLEMIDEEQLHVNQRKTSYLQLVIKETLRKHHMPLFLPRESLESCKIMDYIIPAKTRVVVNMWAISRDKKYWDDPDSFRPERFEESPLDFKGNNFNYLPFGSGRRICPGAPFGLAVLENFLINLLYYFNWECVGYKEGEMDMSETSGIVQKKKSPLILIPTLQFSIPT